MSKIVKSILGFDPSLIQGSFECDVCKKDKSLSDKILGKWVCKQCERKSK
jgi:ribosomal protein L37AE/L43A